jgi:hypothetical protein
LQDFVSRVPEFSKWNHAEKIKFFAWFLHVYEKKERVTGSDIGACYDALHDEQPSSISPFLSNMEKKKPKEAIRDGSGYYLVKKVRDEFDTNYGRRASTVTVEKLLADLPGKVPDHAERVFLDFPRGSTHLFPPQSLSRRHCDDVESDILSSVPLRSQAQAGRVQC